MHHAGDVQRIVHLVVKLGVDRVQGDKSGFIFRQRGIQPLGDQGQRLRADGELGRIELFNLPQQRIFDIQPFRVALQSEMDVVGQRDVDDVMQLARQPFAGEGNNLVGGGDAGQRDPESSSYNARRFRRRYG